MEQNNVQKIREIFYRMINDEDLTIEEVRELSQSGLKRPLLYHRQDDDHISHFKAILTD